MIDVLRIAHLRIAPQEGNLEVGNCEGNPIFAIIFIINIVIIINKITIVKSQTMIALHPNIVEVADFAALVLDEVEQRTRLASAVVRVPRRLMEIMRNMPLCIMDMHNVWAQW